MYDIVYRLIAVCLRYLGARQHQYLGTV